MMFVCLVRFGAGDDVVILLDLIVILWIGPLSWSARKVENDWLVLCVFCLL